MNVDARPGPYVMVQVSDTGTGIAPEIRERIFDPFFTSNASRAVAAEIVSKQTGLPRGDGEVVLVLDDEEAIRKIVRSTLERFGYGVMLASHGAEAVALYAQHRERIALVLTDMAMPVMDGPATIIAIKAIPRRMGTLPASEADLRCEAY